jgi:hypothetical protein
MRGKTKIQITQKIIMVCGEIMGLKLMHIELKSLNYTQKKIMGPKSFCNFAGVCTCIFLSFKSLLAQVDLWYFS